jgi:RNA polymerase sigma factor (sigma-70 family)
MLYIGITATQTHNESDILDKYIQDIARGDKNALGKLYEHTRSAIYGFSLSIVKNVTDAEDVLQDVYVKVYAAAPSYSSKGKPMAWLLTIARNQSLMRLREQSKAILLPSEEVLYAHQPAVTDEDRLVVKALLSELKDEERQIVVLHSLTGLKHREIAALLKIPLPTVLSKYNRAIKKLRKFLKEEERYV